MREHGAAQVEDHPLGQNCRTPLLEEAGRRVYKNQHHEATHNDIVGNMPVFVYSLIHGMAYDQRQGDLRDNKNGDSRQNAEKLPTIGPKIIEEAPDDARIKRGEDFLAQLTVVGDAAGTVTAKAHSAFSSFCAGCARCAALDCIWKSAA